jgi:anti-sigma B factor antagonist
MRSTDVSTELFTRTDDGDLTILHMYGKLDVITANEVKMLIDQLLEEERLRVVVDLEGLTMIDSSGVGAIVGLYKRVRAAGGHVDVTGARGQPLTIFKLLRMDRVFGLA